MNPIYISTVLFIGFALLGGTATTAQEKTSQPASPTNGTKTSHEIDDNGTKTNAPGQRAATRPNRRAGLAALAVDARKIQQDVVYGKADDVELKLDLYFPKKTEGKLPVTVYVHGGGWQNGDKGAGAGAMAIGELVKRGYLVASVNYRLAPTYKFPAQIEDVKCAIRFLRAHASDYQLDPKRMGVWGGSAGGHLVALLGTSDAKIGLEGKGGWADQSSRVQAVVDMFGPADLTVEFPGGNARIIETVFGASSSKDEVLKRASPVTHVTSDDPPFLILHGENDRLVPLSQSEKLHERLKAAGVPSKLVVVKNAGHSFKPEGGTPQPDRNELTQMIGDFFDKTLKK
ncbi:MAG: alpha/beta hydrolase [Verrucomicrobiota bacterium]